MVLVPAEVVILINSTYKVLLYLLRQRELLNQLKSKYCLVHCHWHLQRNHSQNITHLFHHSNTETHMRSLSIHVHPHITSGIYRKDSFIFYHEQSKGKTILYTDPKHKKFGVYQFIPTYFSLLCFFFFPLLPPKSLEIYTKV